MKKNYDIKHFWIILTILLTLPTMRAYAVDDPVTFSVKKQVVDDRHFDLVFTGRVDDGWHVYSTRLPSGGPISTTLNVEKITGLKAVGKLQFKGKEIEQQDALFGMKLRYFEHSVVFFQRYEITAEKYAIKGYLEYGACNDHACSPPMSTEFDIKGSSDVKAAASTASTDAAQPTATDAEKNQQQTTEAALATAATQADGMTASDSLATAHTAGASANTGDTLQNVTTELTAVPDLWKPVTAQLSEYESGHSAALRSWIYIFIMGFIGGLLALFTPCVWPIIPMTVSFFLKRSGDRRKGVRDAITYGLAIIIIYLSLGLAVTAILGPNKLNELATNAAFNIFFFLLLVVFALSFFGWFELTLPSSWSNKVDSRAGNTGGFVSIFLMAFTLALVSFSCTGPIIGFLLVEVSTSGNILGPALGMFGFALALALPFTLFALFPSWLKSAPKSGSWMNTIKVVLGFIELAFALKFFSVADLAYHWGLLDREVFLSLWIVIFGLLGLYLVGLIKFPHDDQEQRSMPVVCIMGGMISLAFTVYMIPGLWGAPCKAVSAFAPPMSTQDFNLYKGELHPAYFSYEEGMQAAKAQRKPVLIDFTGHGCVNCRKMEAAVWTDPKVMELLTKDYILISLYVDDKTPLPKKLEITEEGRKRTLRTVGDKWSYLQRVKFGANAQPFYVPLDADGNLLGPSYSYDENVGKYVNFLQKALDNHRK